MSFSRRQLLTAAASAAALPTFVHAQKLDKSSVTIAVGGKNLLYYLPLTVAEQLGYFKAEGLDAKIVDFAGGSRALQAVVGGSADVVSGAFEHTVNMQFKGQRMRAFVLQGRAPEQANTGVLGGRRGGARKGKRGRTQCWRASWSPWGSAHPLPALAPQITLSSQAAVSTGFPSCSAAGARWGTTQRRTLSSPVAMPISPWRSRRS